MMNNLTYDEALARLEALTKELETAEAIGMDEYKTKASEAKELITFCRARLTELEGELNQLLPAE